MHNFPSALLQGPSGPVGPKGEVSAGQRLAPRGPQASPGALTAVQITEACSGQKSGNCRPFFFSQREKPMP